MSTKDEKDPLGIEKLKEKAQRLLRALTDDPQPGLMCWHEMVARICGEIAEYAKPDLAAIEKLYACSYARTALHEGDLADLEPDWDDVRAQARELIADSELRGSRLLDALDRLDDQMTRNGHYRPEKPYNEDE